MLRPLLIFAAVYSTVQLLVQEAKARRATLVASLHAVDLARQCFDRLIVIRHGRVAFDVAAYAVTEAQLQALYAATPDVPGAHGAAGYAPAASAALPSHGCC